MLMKRSLVINISFLWVLLVNWMCG